MPPLVNGAPLDYFHDGSGRGRHCDQRQREARPQWRALGGGAFARFDGQNDFLAAAVAPRMTMAGATVFVFAAPASNPGLFCGLLAWNARGKNDYQSGFNVDLGGGPSTNWNRVNVEGGGATGEKNLLREPVAFGALHTLVITMEPGPSSTACWPTSGSSSSDGLRHPVYRCSHGLSCSKRAESPNANSSGQGESVSEAEEHGFGAAGIFTRRFRHAVTPGI